jgi:hypothetical protein
MINLHNAMINWRDEVLNWKYDIEKQDSNMFGFTYTIDIEEALVRNDGQPIIFFGEAIDISKEANKYLVHFHNCSDFFSRSANIHFILDCTDRQMKKILKHREKKPNKYAVFCEVKKVKLNLTNVSSRKANAFIAEGRCLDLLFVGDYRTSSSFKEKYK